MPLSLKLKLGYRTHTGWQKNRYYVSRFCPHTCLNHKLYKVFRNTVLTQWNKIILLELQGAIYFMTIYNCMVKKLNTSLKVYLLGNKMINSCNRQISSKGLFSLFPKFKHIQHFVFLLTFNWNHPLWLLIKGWSNAQTTINKLLFLIQSDQSQILE